MSTAIHLLCQYLSHRDVITGEERDILLSLPQRTVLFQKGAEIVAEGSRPDNSCFIYSGWTARAVHGRNGARQLTALHVAGDFVDLHALVLKQMDHSVVALSECVAVFIPHESLRAITEQAPHLTRLLWMSTTIDAAIQRKMTALIGRHTPAERLAHLMCEVYLRLEAIGHIKNRTFRFPLTQSEIADLLGLSLVHTNRTIRDLRATNWIIWEQFDVTIPDFAKLAKFAGFDSNYLNLRVESR
ncbi:Crp/Fnr family transcriptional regulator [Oryzicola mucosus]|uniref:Crp/Fnr family transcriptional regulator n=1 Tax=Oryzicola mucosus TaxID=2767425 RepID=A0A8J6PV25_9HYPH|nr:Crp/Fnr family transcriptional regulator [Oryzicola mucosus]MBD0415216.1 Crp/Fnr family transcriptional regulator [Oryzicola mucosus]